MRTCGSLERRGDRSGRRAGHRHLRALFALCGLIAAAVAAGQPVASAQPAVETTEVLLTEVCFTVHNPGELFASTVRGTLFHTPAYTEQSTALLLQHGAVSERSYWDGGRPGVQGAPSVARRLAEAGYGIFAIDRLGYAASPYDGPPGSGWLLTGDGYVEMTHEIVTQIRDGSFRVTEPGASCSAGDPARHAASHVVLSGVSFGAAITELYATRYHDIAGIIPMSWGNQPGRPAIGARLFFEVVVPQWLEGKDYIEFFTDGADGYSEFCEELLFYPLGIQPNALQQLCGTGYFAETRWPTPSGEFASITGGVKDRIRATVGLVGPTPVLLVFGDRDALFPLAPNSGAEADLVTPEIAMWRSSCNCEVSVYIQPDSGHVNSLHQSTPRLVATMVGWLQGHGL